MRARGLPGGRAALFLAGAALAPGCVDEPEPDGLEEQGDGGARSDAGRDAGQTNVTPVYGIALDAGRDSGLAVMTPYGISTDPWRDAQIISLPAYGISIPVDAGPQDAGCPRVGNLPVPVYGVPVDSGPQVDVCRDAGQDAAIDSGFSVATPYGIAVDSGR